MNTRPVPTNRWLLFVLAAGALTLGSCGSCIPQTPIETALDLVERAIIDLRDASADWQQVLRDLQAELAETAQSTVRNEVDQVVQRAFAGAQVGVFCTVDFIRDRTGQWLQEVVDRLRNRQARAPAPKICRVIPNSVNGNVDPARRYQIDVVGYDMDSLRAEDKLQLFLINEGQSPRDVTGSLSIVTHYEATINLGATGVPLTTASRRLELRHPRMLTSNIAVIHPQPPPPRVVDVQLGTRDFDPPKAPGSGDREFKSHGPCVTTKAELRNNGGRIESRVFMDAYECHSDFRSQSDHTRATGWSSWEPAPPFEPGTRILEIVSPTSSEAPRYRDTSHGPVTKQMGLGDLVKSYTTIGDTGGDDVGSGTSVQVQFNTVKVRVQPPAPQGFVTVDAFNATKRAELAALGTTFVPRSLADAPIVLNPN